MSKAIETYAGPGMCFKMMLEPYSQQKIRPHHAPCDNMKDQYPHQCCILKMIQSQHMFIDMCQLIDMEMCQLIQGGLRGFITARNRSNNY